MYHLRVSDECVAFTLYSDGLHDFDPKLPFSSGEVFSEQGSPYQTGMVSLESKSIVEVLFKGLS